LVRFVAFLNQEFTEWSKTAAAGFMSGKEAAEHWQKLLADPKVLKDKKGYRGQLRVAVEVKTMVNEYTDQGLGKRTEGIVSTVKKPTQEQTDNYKTFAQSALASTNFDRSAGAELVATFMAAASGTSTEDALEVGTSGITIDALHDKTSRRLSSRKSDEEAGSAEVAVDGDRESEVTDLTVAGKPPLKRRKMWNGDLQCANAELNFKSKVDQTSAEVRRVKSEMEAAVAEFTSDPEAEHYTKYVTMVNVRLEAVKLVVGTQPADLVTHLQNYDAGDCGGSVVSGGGGHTAKSVPCPLYRELVTLTVLRERSAEFNQCSSEDDLKTLKAAVNA
jgi:hypothetical protein